MTSNPSRFLRRLPIFRALPGALLFFFFSISPAQTLSNKNAAADSLLIAVNNIAIAGEYSLRGFTANFAFPVMSMISVTDDSGNVVPGLADTLRWLDRNENAEIGLPIAQIWQPLLEYHRDNPAFPSDPNIYNQTPGPYFTEVRKSEPFPTSTMLVMDVSGSMQEALEDAKLANRIYVDLLRGVDRGGVIQFDNTVVRSQKMTGDKDLLRAIIAAAAPAGATAIYDALDSAITEMKLESNRRRAIILYTDGNDNASQTTPQAVIDSALAYGIPIFTIALGDLTSEEVLKRIARLTGGLFFKSASAREMSLIYRRLSDIIQNFYVMAHGSTDPARNNTWRIVEVTAELSNRLGHGLGQYFVPGLPPPPGPTDLALDFTSRADTSIVVNNKTFNAVRPGEAYSYRLTVRNQGTAASENIRVSQFLPDSVRLLGSSQPLLFTDGDSLVWRLARLDPGREDSILVAVQLAAAIPNDLVDLVSSARLSAPNDTSTSNNAARDTVKVILAPLPLQTDIAVLQSAQTDSFAVVGNDTLRFARAGETYSYQITVRNLGGVAAQNVIVTDFLPDSIRAGNFQPMPNLSTADSLQWRLGDLPALSQMTLRFNATVSNNMPVGTNLLINKISGSTDNEDPIQLANNVAIDTVRNVVQPPQPDQATDLALNFMSMTDTSIMVDGKVVRAVQTGGQYQYHIKVANRGPATANAIRVRQTLPDSVRLIESTLTPIINSTDSLVWQIGSLNAGREDSISVTVRLAQNVPFALERLISSAGIFARNDTTPANNAASDTVYVIFSEPLPQRAKLAVRQIAQTDSFSVSGNDTLRYAKSGETYSYLITVSNESEVIAQNVTLDEVLPDSIRAENFQPAPAFISSDSLRWNLGNLTPRARLVLRFDATVSDFMPVGTNLLINKITAHAENEDPAQLGDHVAIDTVYNIVEPSPGNATDLAVTVNSITDTSVVENGKRINAVRLGEVFDYRIAVQNFGPAHANNVRMRQALPDSVRFIRATLPPLSANQDSLLWQIGQVNAGNQDSILVTVQLAATVPQTLTQLISRVDVFAANDTLPANNAASDTTKVLFIPAPPLQTDVAVFQRAQTDSFAVVGNDTLRFARSGETYSYQITVRNLGNVAAQNVIVSDLLPDSIRAGSFQPPPVLITADSLQWRLGNLPALGQTILRYEVTVSNSMRTGTNFLVNKVTARADNEDAVQLANNVSIDTVYNIVKPQAGTATDLSLNFSSITDTSVIVAGKTFNAARPGEAFAYRLRIRNLGPAPAQNVLVSQLLPDSVRVLGFSQPPLSASTDSVAWQINRIEAGSVDSITVAVQLAAPIPNTLLELISRARFFAVNDTLAANNSAGDTVKVLFGPPPPLQTDLAVFQSARTDSFAVVGNDTLHFARAGETYSYRLTIRNASSVTAQNVIVTNFLPDSIRAGNFQPPPNLITADSLQWRLGNLLPLNQATIQFEATVAAKMPVGTNLLINKISGRANNENPTRLADNVAVDTVYNVVKPPQPPSNATDLALAFTSVTDTNIVVDGKLAPAVRPGEEYEYRIKVRNRGPAQANNIRVTQFLPDSVQFVQATQPPISINADSLAWQINQLNAGREDSIAVTVKLAAVVPPDLFSLISRAQLVAANDTTAANNAAADTAYVIFRQPPPGPKAILAVRQIAQTDSFAVSGNDTLRYAKSGETYFYLLTVSNESNVLAQNVTLTDFLPDSIRASNFQPSPVTITSDSLHWQLGNLTPRAKLSLQFEATVSRFMPLGTNLLINKIVAHATNEDPTQSNNVAIDTVYNLVKPLQTQPPLIAARPPVINVRDSVFVRVQVPVPIMKWDLWVYLADGRIDSNYADAFIVATPLTPGIWVDVAPAFTNTRLFTAAKTEQIIFEIRTRDIFGFAGTASATVVVQSNNDMVLDRNVFEADRQGPLEINFKLSSNRVARLDVFDMAGHHVTNLTEAPYAAGWNTYLWNGFIAERGYPVGSGVYLITLRSGEYDDWKKVIIAR